MTRRRASNDFERLIIDNIRRYGWHSNSVGIDPDSAMFAYTVGFLHSYGHPELIVFGLSPQTSHGIFRAAARSIARGRPLDTAGPNDGLIDGYPCVLVKVPKRHYAEYLCSARWYYNGNGFPVYQVVWPSEEGHYPWHPDASDAFTGVQPVLGQITRSA